MTSEVDHRPATIVQIAELHVPLHLIDPYPEPDPEEERRAAPFMERLREFLLRVDSDMIDRPVRLGPGFALPSSVDAVRRLIDGFGAAGVDELMLWPTIAELDQVDLLAGLL